VLLSKNVFKLRTDNNYVMLYCNISLTFASHNRKNYSQFKLFFILSDAIWHIKLFVAVAVGIFK